MNDSSHATGGEPAFLLTRQWRDTAAGIELELWARTAKDAVRIHVGGERATCFARRGIPLPGAFERRAVDLACPDGDAVDALYFDRQADLREFTARMPAPRPHLFETDIRPDDRYLMERFIQGPVTIHGVARQGSRHRRFDNPHLVPGEFRPQLSLLSIDIETDYESGELFSIGASGAAGERVFIRLDGGGHGGDPPIVACGDERELLRRFLDYVQEVDPDVLIGWNVIAFDLAILERHCRRLNVRFALGREAEPAYVVPARGAGQTAVARVPGRVVMDGIESLRAAFYSFESFALENVAARLLGRGKLIDPGEGHRGEEIRRLFADDPLALARYNLEDCRLVSEIFAHTDLVEFSMERAASTGLALGRPGGSVAAFDFLYLPRLHRRGYVAPDPPLAAGGGSSPGGYVLDSRPGLFDNVLVFDFKSLYPSIIRTFKIDPLALWLPGEPRVEGFEGASFSREDPILPTIIDRLWAQREAARRSGNAPLSQAVKIIMNSFYGVLGATACRFFDPRLTASITRRGHEIIKRSRDFLAAQGYEVIYGDTDSLFIRLGAATTESDALHTGRTLAERLNDFWADAVAREHRLESRLEIEFETLYLKFLMPTVRGSGAGSKKRYAGLVRNADGSTRLVFRGLETVRSDWTPLAREFQQELFRLVFNELPFDGYVRDVHQALYAGRLDDRLVYRKQLRQDLDRYRRNVPPHARAARKLARPGRYIDYVICTGGPEPAGSAERLDYDHYAERQLKPVADTILLPIGTSFDEIIGGQMELFSGPLQTRRPGPDRRGS